MSCDPNDLLEQAKCFRCIPKGLHPAVQSYLLASIAGGSMDPTALLREASCISSCLPTGLLKEIKTYLLCEIVNNLVPTPPTPINPYDPDALEFFLIASITDDTTRAAVNQLVLDLKAYPLVGTKFWDRMTIIYPFAGTTFNQQRINLRNPLLYPFYAGAGVTFSALGAKGSGLVGGYIDTTYNMQSWPDVTNCSVMLYMDTLDTIVSLRYYLRAFNNSDLCMRADAPAAYAFRWDSNNTFVLDTSTAGVLGPGAFFVQRADNVSALSGVMTANWKSFPKASAAYAGVALICLIAANSISAGTDARISGFSLGTKFAVTTPPTERNQYKTIWDTYQTALGRGHP